MIEDREHEPLLKDGADFSIAELKSRLQQMDIDFDVYIKRKQYFVDIYNNKIQDEVFRNKIKDRLIKDLDDINEKRQKRLRRREKDKKKNQSKESKSLKQAPIPDNYIDETEDVGKRPKLVPIQENLLNQSYTSQTSESTKNIKKNLVLALSVGQRLSDSNKKNQNKENIELPINSVSEEPENPHLDSNDEIQTAQDHFGTKTAEKTKYFSVRGSEENKNNEEESNHLDSKEEKSQHSNVESQVCISPYEENQNQNEKKDNSVEKEGNENRVEIQNQEENISREQTSYKILSNKETEEKQKKRFSSDETISPLLPQNNNIRNDNEKSNIEAIVFNENEKSFTGQNSASNNLYENIFAEKIELSQINDQLTQTNHSNSIHELIKATNSFYQPENGDIIQETIHEIKTESEHPIKEELIPTENYIRPVSGRETHQEIKDANVENSNENIQQEGINYRKEDSLCRSSPKEVSDGTVNMEVIPDEKKAFQSDNSNETTIKNEFLERFNALQGFGNVNSNNNSSVNININFMGCGPEISQMKYRNTPEFKPKQPFHQENSQQLFCLGEIPKNNLVPDRKGIEKPLTSTVTGNRNFIFNFGNAKSTNPIFKVSKSMDANINLFDTGKQKIVPEMNQPRGKNYFNSFNNKQVARGHFDFRFTTQIKRSDLVESVNYFNTVMHDKNKLNQLKESSKARKSFNNRIINPFIQKEETRQSLLPKQNEEANDSNEIKIHINGEGVNDLSARSFRMDNLNNSRLIVSELKTNNSYEKIRREFPSHLRTQKEIVQTSLEIKPLSKKRILFRITILLGLLVISFYVIQQVSLDKTAMNFKSFSTNASSFLENISIKSLGGLLSPDEVVTFLVSNYWAAALISILIAVICRIIYVKRQIKQYEDLSLKIYSRLTAYLIEAPKYLIEERSVPYLIKMLSKEFNISERNFEAYIMPKLINLKRQSVCLRSSFVYFDKEEVSTEIWEWKEEV